MRGVTPIGRMEGLWGEGLMRVRVLNSWLDVDSKIRQGSDRESGGGEMYTLQEESSNFDNEGSLYQYYAVEYQRITAYGLIKRKLSVYYIAHFRRKMK